MTYRAGELVELVQAESLGLAGTVPKGTQGVVLREPGLLSRGYLVRLDPAGRQVELPAEALRASGGVGRPGPPLRSSPEPPWWRRRPAHSHRGSRSAAQESPRAAGSPASSPTVACSRGCPTRCLCYQRRPSSWTWMRTRQGELVRIERVEVDPATMRYVLVGADGAERASDHRGRVEIARLVSAL